MFNNDFIDYQDYRQFTLDMWEEGWLNELEADELVIKEKETINDKGILTVFNRLLTEEEFNKRFKNGK